MMLRPTQAAELMDRAQISDTLNAYCDFVDTSQIDPLVELFTQDTLVDMGQGAIFRGRVEFRALLLDRIGMYTTTNHHCSNIRFTHYDGETACTTSYLYAYHDAPERNQTMQLWGRYLDVLTKKSGSWQFAERHLRVAGVSYAPSQQLPARFERFSRNPLPAHD